MEAKLKRNKIGSHDINLKGLHDGEVVALVRSLKFYNSAVSSNLLLAIRLAAEETDKDLHQTIKEVINLETADEIIKRIA